MPSAQTFEIKPIRELIGRYIESLSVDPFANSSRIADVTNDLDPAMRCDYCLDALDFLRTFADGSVRTVLFDPPYSPRQVAENYKRLRRTVTIAMTQMSFWANMKDEIARILAERGVCISCAWNSSGIGGKRGMVIEEIMLIAHGSTHNDTIITVERKQAMEVVAADALVVHDENGPRPEALRKAVEAAVKAMETEKEKTQ